MKLSWGDELIIHRLELRWRIMRREAWRIPDEAAIINHESIMPGRRAYAGTGIARVDAKGGSAAMQNT
jgi:hypothetical protein